MINKGKKNAYYVQESDGIPGQSNEWYGKNSEMAPADYRSEQVTESRDAKRQPVERYRITDDQKAFLKKINRFQSIRQTLEKVTLQKQAEFKNLQAMWQALGKGMQILRNEAPKEMVHDLPGMRFSGEAGEAPNETSGFSDGEKGEMEGE